MTDRYGAEVALAFDRPTPERIQLLSWHESLSSPVTCMSTWPGSLNPSASTDMSLYILAN